VRQEFRVSMMCVSREFGIRRRRRSCHGCLINIIIITTTTKRMLPYLSSPISAVRCKVPFRVADYY